MYQDRLRKDVKKMIAVATVPFLSLISFQRRLSSPLLGSARLSVGDPATAAASSSCLCLQDIDEGVHADIWGRQAFEKYWLFNGTVNRLER